MAGYRASKNDGSDTKNNNSKPRQSSFLNGLKDGAKSVMGPGLGAWAKPNKNIQNSLNKKNQMPNLDTKTQKQGNNSTISNDESNKKNNISNSEKNDNINKNTHNSSLSKLKNGINKINDNNTQDIDLDSEEAKIMANVIKSAITFFGGIVTIFPFLLIFIVLIATVSLLLKYNTENNFYNLNLSLNGNSSYISNSNSTSNQTNVNVSKFIFVGDSRTVGMKSAVGTEDDIWSAKVSMGLNWMKSTGIPNIESDLTEGAGLFILMGVNDLGNSSKYVEYINSNIDKWTTNGSNVFFVSVMPCDGSYSNLNSKIEKFNSTLKSELNNKVKYIDTYEYLKNNGFKTTDGLHYNNETYKKIYNYIKSNIN